MTDEFLKELYLKAYNFPPMTCPSKHLAGVGVRSRGRRQRVGERACGFAHRLAVRLVVARHGGRGVGQLFEDFG